MTPESRPLHDDIAEQGILGAILSNPDLFDDVRLEVNDFYWNNHQLIFGAMREINRAGGSPDYLAVNSHLQKTKKLLEAGGSVKLTELLRDASFGKYIVEHVEILKELGRLRGLHRLAMEIEQQVNGGMESNKIAAATEKSIDALYAVQMGGKWSSMNHVTQEAIDKIESAYKGQELIGITTGLKGLDRILGGLHKSDMIIVAGRPSMGKAQPLDAMILTGKGWKKMGDLSIGDRLASHDGVESAVTGIYPQGLTEILRVTFSDGRSTECCAEHLWKVSYRGRWTKVLPTKTLMAMLDKRHYRKRLWIDKVDGSFGEKKELPIKPWVLGVLLGDGHFMSGTPMLSTPDEEVLNRMREDVGDGLKIVHSSNYDYRIVMGSKTHMANGAPSSNPLTDKLKGLGLWGKHSFERFIPLSYKNSSRDDRVEILRGLLDTDGWVEKKGSLRFSSSSIMLANDVASIARSLGACVSIKKSKAGYKVNGVLRECHDCYTITIRSEAVNEFVTLKKKRSRLTDRNEPRLTFSSIELVGVKQAQCIKVSHPDQLYITDDYIVTHNTSLALQLAYAAAKAKKKVGVVSLEMSNVQLANRLLAMNAVGLSVEALRQGTLTQRGWMSLTNAAMLVSPLPIYLCDDSVCTLSEIKAKAKLLQRTNGLDLLIVDYLQLMESSQQRNRNREGDVSEVSRGLKQLAKRLDIPVVALSQLSRRCEERPDKRPIPSDLRESGSLEQDSDVILMLYRDEVYHDDSPDKGLAEILVRKHRNGAIGDIRVGWDGPKTMFFDEGER